MAGRRNLRPTNIADHGMGFLSYPAVERRYCSASSAGSIGQGEPTYSRMDFDSDSHYPRLFFDTVSSSEMNQSYDSSHTPSLFSWGVRESITLHLRGDGMSFAAFISFIKISTRSLILNPRRRVLSLMSIVVIILTGVQTAGFVMFHGVQIAAHLTFTQVECFDNASCGRH
jgi:hypothetical protein